MPLTFFWNRKKTHLKNKIFDLNQEILSLKDQFNNDRNILEEICRKTEEKCRNTKEKCAKIMEELQATQLQLTEQKSETKRLQQARDKAFQSLKEEQACKASLMQNLDLKNLQSLEQFVQEWDFRNGLLTRYKNRKKQFLLSNNSLNQKLCVKDDHILKKNVELSDTYEKIESLEEKLTSERHLHELQEKHATIAQLTKDLEEQKCLNQRLQKERKTAKDERMKEKEEALRMNKILTAKKETSLQSVLQVAEEPKSSLQHSKNERNNLARPRLPQEVLLAIGGWRGDSSTNIIESYDNRAKRWVGVANCDETPRRFHGTVFLHGSVYLIGGSVGVYELCTTHKYDLANYTWQKVAPMHTQRGFISVALLDGFIYAMGGFNGGNWLNTAEKYFPNANQWTMIAPMNEKRSNASSTAYNRKLYICGGFNGRVCLSTAECYDPLTNQWTMISAMSSRRSGVGVIAYFNEIYVLGGFNGRDNLKTVEAYNPNTNTWRPLPPMLRSRGLFGIGVVEEKLYAVGGLNSSFRPTNCVESFDVKTGVWSKVRNMNISRSGLSCCVVYDLTNMADYSAAHSSPPEEVPEE